MMRCSESESGFTIIEVAIASVISTIGLLFLASLFTLSISQNRMNKQFSATTALAQQKLEELNAIDFGDDRIKTGGDLANPSSSGGINYFDDVLVNDQTGTIQINGEIPNGQVPNYRRYWRIENDPELANTVIVSARVVALQAGHNVGQSEETTLTTVRSH